MHAPATKVEFGIISLVSSDERRDIHEVAFADSSFQDFLVKNCPKPLGQHFHRHKSELFYFIAGGGTIRVAPVDMGGQIAGDVQTIEVQPGLAVHIPAWRTHRFDLTPQTRFVCFSSRPFDPTDLNACPIE